MSYYDYEEFTHLVPDGHVVPKHTQVRRVGSSVETFFTTQYDLTIHASENTKYFLDYDITKPKPPSEINSLIYNVRVGRNVFFVAVYQGFQIWSAFSKKGERSTLYTVEIESFDTTPSAEESDHE